ncbi:carboxymuconolactone decarboxylase family protein [Paractinoplanes brasiliensis]|uniref:AhpD family alkylhydroperoxidase n=1 Tax=Paractinoplanes brasiliensis TaxID=52695 RepID=A0A4R6JA51_9ACTN|nr:carboxymuconolactone decarboxylase family protein [Actinoplanes brasiliensis]TDO32509.1 AhpD family alkylhydroperoxidase [Actinoplanes brasiliensis]GID27616.1 alkyl hydroperoxide reductase AhpD [Actinoplanes brasiliensis]
MTYRFFTPPKPAGLAARVNDQLREDFLGPLPAFQALSPAADVMAATWSLMRESLLADAEPPADRAERELVAAVVSRANRCRFCLDAHVTLLHGLGEHDLAERVARGDPLPGARHAELARWATAGRTPRKSAWTSPYGPHLTGTALTFHFLNRMVSALLAPDLLPGGLQRLPAVRSVGGRLVARSARRPKEPGRSLNLLPAATSPPPAWSGRTPVGTAYAALFDTAGRGGSLLGDAARETVVATVRWEDGRHPGRPAEWATDLVRGLPATDRVGARIALLAAFAPYAISAGDVGLWQLSHPAEADLVRLVAFGAITATDHVARALDPAHR